MDSKDREIVGLELGIGAILGAFIGVMLASDLMVGGTLGTLVGLAAVSLLRRVMGRWKS